MKLWGGRFEKATDDMVDDFHSSISFDKRLIRQDIAGSVAHATMLGDAGIIPKADADKIVAGLSGILEDALAGRVAFSEDAEDVHMNVEKLLTERIGEAGKRLHTARSRNDQVALDTRMFTKDAIRQTDGLLRDLMRALLDTAKEHTHTVMPGYTHLQKAQPVTLAHHLMAWFEMLRRDRDRLEGAYARADVMPLGSGALAAVPYPIDRNQVAGALGFSQISRNSLDAVADRDFCIEYISCAAMSMMHLSRMCEELILWASDEFRFVEMDDAFATGSSIMPQKKNPDVAELIRGKTGRVYGDLTALLVMMKGLPLAYDKDMQEDKEALFDAHDTWTKCLVVFTGMLRTLSFRKDVLERAAAGGFTNATDAADYLVKKGVPFRDAHAVSGRMVLYCIRAGKTLGELNKEELYDFSPLFQEDYYDAVSLKTCVSRRNVPGGPAPEAVQRALDEAERYLG